MRAEHAMLQAASRHPASSLGAIVRSQERKHPECAGNIVGMHRQISYQLQQSLQHYKTKTTKHITPSVVELCMWPHLLVCKYPLVPGHQHSCRHHQHKRSTHQSAVGNPEGVNGCAVASIDCGNAAIQREGQGALASVMHQVVPTAQSPVQRHSCKQETAGRAWQKVVADSSKGSGGEWATVDCMFWDRSCANCMQRLPWRLVLPGTERS